MARILGPVVRLVGQLLPARSDDGDRATLADTYHGKVVPLEGAAQLVTVAEDVTLGGLGQTIPYPLARDIVLKNPDHIVVLECPCSTAPENPCQPLDACLIVSEPLASFMIEHHPQRSRWISRSEAVNNLRAEQARGHVSHAPSWGCDARAVLCQLQLLSLLLRDDAGPPAGHAYAGLLGRCRRRERRAVRRSLPTCSAVVDVVACMGCGVCVSQCLQEAISLLRDPAKGEPLVIQELMTYAAQATER